MSQSTTSPPSGAPSRRRLFGVLGAGAALGAAGFAGGRATGSGPEDTPGQATPTPAPPPEPVAFDGIHQAGIATPAQANIVLTAYDLASGAGTSELAAVLKAWTTAARALTAGTSVTDDPTINIGDPASLTVTVGVGGALLDRLGISSPEGLQDLPAFAGDDIDPALSNGDIVVQLCADDPLVLAQADRVLTRLAAPTLLTRWQQQGFGSTGARSDGRTGRNLMGQLDGTNNVTTSQLVESGPIWVDDPQPAWLTGGSYLVVRRIRMLLDAWDREDIHRQERIIGRTKDTGAPLGSTHEADFVDLDARDADGEPVIPADSHARLAAPQNSAENMMRRGYSYRGQALPDGTVDQGLLFLSYQKDPRTSFVPVQQRLSEQDALTPFTVTTGSGIFAILPGTRDSSDWLGSGLLS